MKLKQLNKSKGFTIIETLIVLAIAATIFLVVFLAVTALNRSSRNTQRKDDAAAMIAGFSEYASNNSGVLPLVGTYSAPDIILCATGPCTGAATAPDVQARVKLGYYNAAVATTIGTKGAVYIGNSTALPATPNDSLNVITGATCVGSLPSTTANGASSRSVVAVYGVESASGFSWQCDAS